VTDKSKLLPPVLFIKYLDATQLCFFTKEDVRSLEEEGYIIKDNFMKNFKEFDFLATQLYQEAEQLRAEGKFKLAGMGTGKEHWNDKKVRGDELLWVNNRWQFKDNSPTLYNVLVKLDMLRNEFNNACQLNSPEKTQTQLACYPGEGTHYVRHLDSFVGGSTRRLTALYYLNPNWKKGDGGELRMYLNNGEWKDIEPIADRLVIFQSRRMEHEVLPSFQMRYALTMWFY